MKYLNPYIAFASVAVLALSLASCQERIPDPYEGMDEVVLTLAEPEPVRGGGETRSGFSVDAEDIWFCVETRAISEVTTLNNQNVVWAAVTPSGNWSPTSSQANASGTVRTGHYAANGSTTSNTYYVTNSPAASNLTLSTSNNTTQALLTVSGTGTTGTDIVAGKATSSSVSVPVTLEHIFARTGAFTLQAPSGVTVSNVSWTLKSHGSVTGTAGVYNITTGNWTSVTSTLSERTVNSSSNLYLVPGTYDVTVSCTVTRNGVSQQVTRTGTVPLTKGKVNNITAGFSLRYELMIDPSSSSIAIGGTQAYTATLRTWLRFGSTDVVSFDNVLTSGLTWSSSNTSVATVSGGVATGVSAGNTNITVYYTPSGSSQLSSVAVLVVRSNDDIDPGWDPGSGLNL